MLTDHACALDILPTYLSRPPMPCDGLRPESRDRRIWVDSR